jgi:hypothetical protein
MTATRQRGSQDLLEASIRCVWQLCSSFRGKDLREGSASKLLSGIDVITRIVLLDLILE